MLSNIHHSVFFRKFVKRELLVDQYTGSCFTLLICGGSSREREHEPDVITLCNAIPTLTIVPIVVAVGLLIVWPFPA